MNNYYPLLWVSKKIGEEEVQQMVVSPSERRGWAYLFADNDGEWLVVETNYHHSITSVSFTHKYKGIGMSLKRAQTKGFRICRYPGKLVRLENQ